MGTTQLSDTTIPLEDEIAEDLQFVPELITRAEFEKIWEKATKTKTIQDTHL
ncbi:hypothetical protein VIBC2010_04474 [Vibrio caribbeanicus ATCC BAA-2122]|uniref:DUF6881 domain-containing protein n=1 Tax=Vibrio caribbeanicus ATCC BAA-2122 TaxID=796620 RepID=E3BGP7_9VIBR|nr:hypothetical protein [Vibrio caribbeanicus]EFP97771.1 hypothetical protein VIBC2010_04474 [Vibrio caribbeanicus ATCC BAA-2122]